MSAPGRWFGDIIPSINDTDQFILKKHATNMARSMGLYGSTEYANTGVTNTGQWCALQATSDTVLATVEGYRINITTLSLVNGSVFRGAISSFQITSGSVIAYNA